LYAWLGNLRGKKGREEEEEEEEVGMSDEQGSGTAALRRMPAERHA